MSYFYDQFMQGKLYIKITNKDKDFLKELDNTFDKYTWMSGDRLYSEYTKNVLNSYDLYLYFNKNDRWGCGFRANNKSPDDHPCVSIVEFLDSLELSIKDKEIEEIFNG